MAIIPEIGVPSYSRLASENHHQQAFLDYRQRLKVSVVTFIAVLLIGLSYVWLQSPIYQSSALLRFIYPNSINVDKSATINRDLSVSEYRLTSQSILVLLRESLGTQGVTLTTEDLSAMLNSKTDANERLIYLFAVDKTGDHLELVINTWLSLYLKQFESQQNNAFEKDRKSTEKKLAELEALIQQQRILLQQFREDNDIVFLEQSKNRIFKKLNTVTQQLSKTENSLIELTSQLAAINQAIRDGIEVSNPYTESLIRKTKRLIQALRSELAGLSRKYTQKYMQKDPNIVQKSRRLTELEITLQTQIKEGTTAYKHETTMQLTKAELKIAELLNQRQSLKGSLQTFSTKLSQYKSMSVDLKNLEKNEQKQKQILLNISVTQPFTPRIDILEYPVTPEYPIGPNYWLNSGIAFIVALLSSIFVLIAFKLIAIKRPSNSTSYTLIQPQSNFIESPLETVEDRHALSHKIKPKALPAQANLMTSQNYLDEQQSHILLSQLSGKSEIALMLIYSGVRPEELLKLTMDQLDIDIGLIHLMGRFQRTLIMPPILQQRLESLPLVNKEQTLLTTILGKDVKLDELSKTIQKTARAAMVEGAELIDVDYIRHSYLVYLVLQGISLKEIEQIAGYIPPNQLGKYKGLMTNDSTIELSEINPIHPTLRATIN
jgi:uncharacterized protein involved in exopolysaccharide biosynthesis